MTGKERRHSDHFLDWLKAYWFLVGFGLITISTLVTLWMKIDYVIAQVNPQTLEEYRKTQTERELKLHTHMIYDDMRWCFTNTDEEYRWKCLEK